MVRPVGQQGRPSTVDRGKVVAHSRVMRRLILGALVAAMLALVASPPLLHAQTWSNDKQNPEGYNNSTDAQPLRLMAYVLTPVGVALEWTVTRPLHYIATETPLRHVLNPGASTRPPVVLSLPPPDKFQPEKTATAGLAGCTASAPKVVKAPSKSGLGTAIVPSQPAIQ